VSKNLTDVLIERTAHTSPELEHERNSLKSATDYLKEVQKGRDYECSGKSGNGPVCKSYAEKIQSANDKVTEADKRVRTASEKVSLNADAENTSAARLISLVVNLSPDGVMKLVLFFVMLIPPFGGLVLLFAIKCLT
jgi:hypothetical protein